MTIILDLALILKKHHNNLNHHQKHARVYYQALLKVGTAYPYNLLIIGSPTIIRDSREWTQFVLLIDPRKDSLKYIWFLLGVYSIFLLYEKGHNEIHKFKILIRTCRAPADWSRFANVHHDCFLQWRLGCPRELK